MAYEIRVVFQSVEAYQTAVEGLYKAFGVDIQDAPPPGRNGFSSHAWAEPLPAGPVLSLDRYLSEDPAFLTNEGYTFTVEDQTRR